jgi:heat shock protein HtpX
MATLYTHQEENIAKTWTLMFVFLVLVMGLGWAISWYFNNPAILVIAVAIAIVTNIVSYWYSDTIVIAQARATPALQAEYPQLHRVVENLCITAGLPKPKLFIVNDPQPNAFATGRNAHHASVAVTTGLLNMMDENELSGVLAHELSHIGNKDMLVMTVAVVLVGFISIADNFFLRSIMWGGDRNERNSNNNPILMVIAVALLILAPLFATLLQLAVSRKREFLADASGALLNLVHITSLLKPQARQLRTCTLQTRLAPSRLKAF